MRLLGLIPCFDTVPDVRKFRPDTPVHLQCAMPVATSSTVIDAPIDRVYSVAKDNESFPEYMDDVKSVEVVERNGERVVTRWVGIVPTFGLKIRWTQLDEWDDEAYRCDFSQVEGDYDVYHGYWTFTENGDQTELHCEMTYEYNVPGLGPLVKKVVHALVTKNLNAMLAAIKQRCEDR